jgi:NhaP-type Na+/H+ or K+/H+ antiporter
MLRAIFLLLTVVVLVAAARSFLPEETSLVGSGAALAFGFVLLASLQAGTVFSSIRMPRLTGYLACGFIAGPGVLNFVTERMLTDLKLINGVAIGLIALTAGGELNFKRMRGRMLAIVSTGGIAMLASLVLVSVAVFALSRYLPFMEGMSFGHRFIIAVTMAVVFSALSPSVAIGIISETGAAGPISEIVLGMVILGDLAIVILFAAVHTLANSAFGGEGGTNVGELVVHIFGSILIGAMIGVVLAVYIKKVNQRIALFVVGICFLCAEAGTRLHLDPLLMCLTAGLFLENLTDIEGAALIDEIQAASLPVYAVFFAVAGAGLHWDAFVMVAPIAGALAVVRAVALHTGSSVGMALAKVPPELRRFIPYGLLPQSGVAIGLCVLLARHFPSWGVQASACLLGAVMINETIGPVLFRIALVRAGEAGRKEAVAAAH